MSFSGVSRGWLARMGAEVAGFTYLEQLGVCGAALAAAGGEDVLRVAEEIGQRWLPICRRHGGQGLGADRGQEAAALPTLQVHKGVGYGPGGGRSGVVGPNRDTPHECSQVRA